MIELMRLPAPILRVSTVLLVAIGLNARGQDTDEAWEIRTHRGRPYLALENVQQNYGFKDAIVEGTAFQLRGPGALIEGQADQQIVRINRLNYHLHYAPVLLDGKIFFSAYDVTHVLDLILRPASHVVPVKLKTVFVEAVEDQWSTRPDANDMALEIQQALAGYGVAVRILDANSGNVATDGAVAWIRLQGNGKLSHYYEYRCSVLAPAGAPERVGIAASADEISAVFPGNQFDAQSLALATLIQSGLIFGPGAKNGEVLDAGIQQTPSIAFRSARGAAVHVEWGEEIDPVHLLKSLAAGILRYSAFLESFRN